jgi:hypothetical protein
MTGILLPVPGLRAVDQNGVPLAGALLQFYLSGTTTPTPVYTAADLATPLSNPVNSDSAGLFPAMFHDPTITYRARLLTSGGSVVQDVDPVAAPPAPAAGSITAAMLGSGAALSNLGFTPVNKTGDTATNLLLSASSLASFSAGYIGAPTNGQNNSYTFALSDAGCCVTCSSIGGFTWTVPPVSAVAFPQGTIILVRNRAAGAITIAPASGVVLRKAGISGSASVSLAIWGFATMMMDETNEWVISGAAIS